MARLFHTGFEIDRITYTNYVAHTSNTQSAPDGHSVANTTVNTSTQFVSGARSLSLASTTPHIFAWSTANKTTGTLFVSFKFRKSANPTANVKLAILDSHTAIGNQGLWLKTDGTLQIYSGAGLTGTTSAALNNSEWYTIQVSYNLGTGLWTAKVNGTQFESTGSTAMSVGRLFLCGTGTTTFYFDDLIINDDSGTVNNSWPDINEKIVLLLPVSDSTNTSFFLGDGTTTTNLYDAVNNTPPTATAADDSARIEGDNVNINRSYRTVTATYASAGIGASDTITAVMPMCCHGEEVATGTKSGQVAMWGNPAGGGQNFNYGDDLGAIGTYPSNWAWAHYGYDQTTDISSIDKDVGVTVSVFQGSGTNRVGSAAFMGVYVGYVPASGTTYPQTCYSSGTGTPSLARTTIYGKTLSLSGSGTPAIAKGISKIITRSATGSPAIVRGVSKTLTVNATGTPSLARAKLFIQQALANGAGTVSLARVLTKLVAQTFSGTGTPALVKGTSKRFSVSSTGTPAIVRSISKRYTVSATGAVTRTNKTGKMFTASGTGSPALVKMPGKVLASTATGTASLARTIGKVFTVAGTGSTALARNIAKILTVAATGTASLSTQLITGVVQQCYAAGTAAVSLAKTVTKNFSVAATGTPSTAKNITKMFAAAATGTVSASQTLITYIVKQCYATGTGAVTLAKTVTKVLATAATGTPTIVRRISKILTRSATGTPTLARASTFGIARTFAATGTATLVKMVGKRFTAAATGTTALVRTIGKRLTVNVTGTVSYSDGWIAVKSLVASAVGTVAFARTFIAAGPPPTLRAIRRAMLRYLKNRT